MAQKIARSILAVMMSLVIMFILTGIVFQVLTTMMPDLKPTQEQIDSGTMTHPPTGVTSVVLLLDLIIAAIGGVLSAAIPVDKPIQHTIILSVMVLALGIVALMSTWGMEPIWYALARTVLAPVCIYAGGWLWTAKKAKPTAEERI